MCHIHVKKCGTASPKPKKTSTKKAAKKTVVAKAKAAALTAAKPKAKAASKAKTKKPASVKGKAKAGKKAKTVKASPKKSPAIDYEKVERILDQLLKEFPKMDAYPDRSYDKIEYMQLNEQQKSHFGLNKKFWWNYYDPAGIIADENLIGRYETKSSPASKAPRTKRICIYNQFTDYAGPGFLANELADRLAMHNIHYRIIGYELESFVFNLFLGSSEKDVVNVVRVFMEKNKVRMDEDWKNEDIAIGRLFGMN